MSEKGPFSTPIDPLIQHLASKDPKLWEALRRLGYGLFQKGQIKAQQLESGVATTVSVNAIATDNDFPRFMYLWTGYQQNYLFKWPIFN